MKLTSSSLCCALFCALAAPLSAQSTTRMSVGSGGTQGDHESYSPALSANGRWVAFFSEATTLVPADTNDADDIFVRDRRTATTVRVSVDSAGVQGDADSYYPAISGDGRHVAFYSEAQNLVIGDTNATEDIFVHDLLTGVTTRVSVDSAGVQGDGRCIAPSISADGRYVAFLSLASNLVAGDTNGRYDAFVHDRTSGITTRVSVDSMGVQADYDCLGAVSISADGSRVAFETRATNLVPGGTSGFNNAYVRDLASGTTTCATVDVNGVPVSGGAPVLSGDGRVLAFQGGAGLLPGDTNGWADIFVRDLVTGVTTIASVATSGAQGNQISSYHSLSFDGRYVAFGSQANNLVPNDTNGLKDIFLRDRLLATTTRINLGRNDAQSNGWSSQPVMSANGRHVGFYSDATNLVNGDTNLERDVFVRSFR